MSKKRGRKQPPPPGGESFDIVDAGFPRVPEGSPPPKSVLGWGPDGKLVVIWRATEAEPTPPPSLWPPIPPGPAR